MKKRLLKVLSLILVIVLCTACGSEQTVKEEDVVGHGADDYLGSYTENTYTNERYGIKFTTPSREFEFALLDEILTANDIQEEGYSNKRVPEILASGKDYMPMYGGDGNTGSSVSLVLSKIEKGTDHKKFVEDAAASVKGILEKDNSISIKEFDVKTGSPVGEDTYFSYAIQARDSTFFTRQFYIFTDTDVACISISATSQANIDNLQKSWKKITK